MEFGSELKFNIVKDYVETEMTMDSSVKENCYWEKCINPFFLDNFSV